MEGTTDSSRDRRLQDTAKAPEEGESGTERSGSHVEVTQANGEGTQEADGAKSPKPEVPPPRKSTSKRKKQRYACAGDRRHRIHRSTRTKTSAVKRKHACASTTSAGDSANEGSESSLPSSAKRMHTSAMDHGHTRETRRSSRLQQISSPKSQKVQSSSEEGARGEDYSAHSSHQPSKNGTTVTGDTQEWKALSGATMERQSEFILHHAVPKDEAMQVDGEPTTLLPSKQFKMPQLSLPPDAWTSPQQRGGNGDQLARRTTSSHRVDTPMDIDEGSVNDRADEVPMTPSHSWDELTRGRSSWKVHDRNIASGAHPLDENKNSMNVTNVIPKDTDTLWSGLRKHDITPKSLKVSLPNTPVSLADNEDSLPSRDWLQTEFSASSETDPSSKKFISPLSINVDSRHEDEDETMVKGTSDENDNRHDERLNDRPIDDAVSASVEAREKNGGNAESANKVIAPGDGPFASLTSPLENTDTEVSSGAVGDVPSSPVVAFPHREKVEHNKALAATEGDKPTASSTADGTEVMDGVTSVAPSEVVEDKSGPTEKSCSETERRQENSENMDVHSVRDRQGTSTLPAPDGKEKTRTPIVGVENMSDDDTRPEEDQTRDTSHREETNAKESANVTPMDHDHVDGRTTVLAGSTDMSSIPKAENVQKEDRDRVRHSGDTDSGVDGATRIHSPALSEAQDSSKSEEDGMCDRNTCSQALPATDEADTLTVDTMAMDCQTSDDEDAYDDESKADRSVSNANFIGDVKGDGGRDKGGNDGRHLDTRKYRGKPQSDTEASMSSPATPELPQSRVVDPSQPQGALQEPGSDPPRFPFSPALPPSADVPSASSPPSLSSLGRWRRQNESAKTSRNDTVELLFQQTFGRTLPTNGVLQTPSQPSLAGKSAQRDLAPALAAASSDSSLAGPPGDLTHIVLCGEWIEDATTPALYGWKAGMKSWRALAKPPKQFCYSSASVLHQGKIVTVGGNLLDGTMVYDMETGRWSQGPPLPCPCLYSSLVGAGSDLVVVIGNAVVFFDKAVGKWVQRGKLAITVSSCSIGVHGRTLLIMGRVDLDKKREKVPKCGNPVMQTFDIKTMECKVHFFCDLNLDMTIEQTAPRYIGVIYGIHCFLSSTGDIFKFVVRGSTLEWHAPENIYNFGLRRTFGTFLENNALTIFGGADFNDHWKPWKCRTISVDAANAKAPRLPQLPYETVVWETFRL